MSFGEFWRRYRILSEENQSKNPSHQEMKSAVEDLLSEMDLDKSAFRLGNSQVSEKGMVLRILTSGILLNPWMQPHG